MALTAGREVHALSFDYGQRHRIELDAARAIAAKAGVAQHIVFSLDLRVFGGSALTSSIEVPKDALAESGIPVTYVPARNIIFLSLATGFAEVSRAEEIWIGVNAIDYSGYPDCRPEFIEAFQNAVLKGTKSGVEQQRPSIVTPLIEMSKAEIIRRGVALGVDYSMTTSCYDPDPAGRACGHCDSCILRRRGFEEAAIADPTRYR